MKLIAFTLASALVPALVVGCGDKPVASSSPAASVSPSPLVFVPKEDLSTITTKLPDKAFANVDFINSSMGPKPDLPVVIDGEKITIAGFAIDYAKGTAASGVVVVIADRPFQATFGGERRDIAETLKNQNYLTSMYYLEIPSAQLSKGMHDMKLRVIAGDKSGYYESDVKARLEVK